MSPSPNAKPAEPANWIDGVLHTGFKLGGLLLCCQLGMLFAAMDLPPYRMTADALKALRAVQTQHEISQENYGTDVWAPERGPEQGVVHNSSVETAAGYTLYSTGNSWSIRLIDMQGTLMHEWGQPFSKAFAGAKHTDTWLPDRFVFPRRSYVFPNGDLIALYESQFTTPNGCGLVKFDKENNVIWRLDRRCHHDMSVKPDGSVVVLTHAVRHEMHPLLPHLETPLIEDFVTLVSADGKERKSFSLLDALARSPFCRTRFLDRLADGDVLHANTVEVLSPAFAACYPELSAGDILVCLRNLNILMAVNPETEQAVWATSGPWHHPHDPDCLPNGNILIFDNGFWRGTTVGSRVIEFDPRTDSIPWQFTASKSIDMRSEVRACQQPLWNGNVLVTESEAGRLREVTPQGNIAWEYVVPERGGPNHNLVPVILGASRVSAESVPFLQVEVQSSAAN